MKIFRDNYFGLNKNTAPPYDILGLPLEVKSEDIEDNGKFKGWGGTFGGAPDAHGDVIVKGAFKETLANNGRNGNGIALLYQHKSDEPIGVWTKLEELDKGLYVEGELDLEVQRARETYSLLKKGAIKGLSIGYDIARLPNGRRDPEAYEYVEQGESIIRFLKKLVLWEISLVTFPANIRATVTGVKMFEGCNTERDWENALRESGLSKQAAQLIISKMRPSLRESGTPGEGDSSAELEQVLAELRKRNQSTRDF